MAKDSKQRSIFVYADWTTLGKPTLMGVLYSTQVRGKEVFSFEYDDSWLKSQNIFSLDPDLQLYTGPQYLKDEKRNFGLFLDSSPDRWGRVLMDRREAVLARSEDRRARTLFETDYLMGVFDGHRMGAIRFKEREEGPFLNNNRQMPSPPWRSFRKLSQPS